MFDNRQTKAEIIEGAQKLYTLYVAQVARTDSIAAMVNECAEGRLSFSDLCTRVSAMGYKTTSLHEMVCAAERSYEDDFHNEVRDGPGNS